jgi:hypothetical protein
MQALNSDKKAALWLLVLCSLVLALQSARADVVTDWNMTAIRASQASGNPTLGYPATWPWSTPPSTMRSTR